jgi:peptide deformylase
MPEAPILPIDDPLLKTVSMPVTVVDDEVRALAKRMFAVMDRANGAGLAAVQIGVPKRLVVMDVRDAEDKHHRLALINPEIIEASEDTETQNEGCLSMPDYDIPVSRSTRVRARYLDLTGQEHVVSATGGLAICLQHEIDHTNGILFTDRVSRLRRDRARSYFAKVRRRASS